MVYVAHGGRGCAYIYLNASAMGAIAFLRDRAFPIMIEAAEFLIDWFVPDPTTAGELTTAPSTSPENTYLDNTGYRASLCKGSAMDIAITRIWTCHGLMPLL